MVPGGDQDLARPVGRKELSHVVELLGVVEDQEPVPVGAAESEGLPHGRHRDVDLTADTEIQLRGEFDEGLLNLTGALRWNPPDQVVVARMAMRVLDGDL